MKKALKRSLSFLLAITIIFSSAYVGLSEFDFSGLDFGKIDFGELFAVKAKAATSGTCGANLTWTLDDEGTLTISGTGAMTNYSSSSNAPWYSVSTSVKSVVIDSGVTSIGNRAFYYCDSLTSVTIPNSVTSIGSYAFYNCNRLTSITIPDSVTSIGNYAFYSCDSLTSITIPNSVTSIGSYAFRYCGLKSVKLGNGLKSIGSWAFNECTQLVLVDFGSSVTNIGDYAFFECTSLTSVTIPDSVTSIGEWAFYDCDAITKIVMGNVIKSIGSHAFSLYDATYDVYITDLAAWCNIDFEDSAANPITYASNVYVNGALSAALVIPEGVTAIKQYAFYNCDSLTSVVISDSVTSIGKQAFDSNSSLSTVSIGVGVTEIDDTAFRYSNKLTWFSVNGNNPYYSSQGGVLFDKNKTTLIHYPAQKSDTEYIIPATVVDIGEYAFYYAKNLTSVIFQYGVINIGEFAFGYCSSLTLIEIPDSVITLGVSTFYLCTNLQSVTLSNNLISIGDNTFYICRKLNSITIPDSVESIGDSVFYQCFKLTSLTIPDSVETIGEEAFKDCCNLETVTIGKGVKSIGVDAFDVYYSSDKLTSVHITDIAAWCNINFADSYSNPLEFGNDLYLNGELVTDLIIPDGVTSIKQYVFDGCTSLTSVVIPDSITSIGEKAFRGCSSLTSITISNSVTSIGYGAFIGCSKITSIVIPDSVTSIGVLAFDGCRNLTSIVIPGSVTSIGNRAFLNTPNVTIYGVAGSYAQTYAEKNGITFKDISGFGSVNIYDNSDKGVKFSIYNKGELSKGDALGIASGSKKPVVQNATLENNGNYYVCGDGDNYNEAFIEYEKLSGKVKITKEGFYDYIVPSAVVSNFVSTKSGPLSVYMTEDRYDGKPYISTVFGRKHDDSCENEYEELQSNSLKVFEIATYDVIVSANLNGDSSATYYLSQDTEHRISSETGVFSQADLYDVFDGDMPVYAYAVTSSGKVTEPVTINISKPDYSGVLKTIVSSSTINLLGSDYAKLGIGDDVPIIGGSDLSMDFVKVPIGVEVEGNRVRISLGRDFFKYKKETDLITNTVEKEKDWISFKETCKEIEKNITENKGLAGSIEKNEKTKKEYGLPDTEKQIKSKSFNFGAEYLGFAEGYVKDDGTLAFTEFSGAVAAEFTAKYGRQLFIGFVPAYYSLQGGVETKCTLELAKTIPDENIPFEFDTTLKVTPKIRARGGVGVDGIVCIGLVGSASLPMAYEFVDKHFTMSLTGKMGLEGEFIGVNVSKDNMLSGTVNIFDTYFGSSNKSLGGFSEAVYGEMAEVMYSDTPKVTYSLASRDYVDSTSNWVGYSNETLGGMQAPLYSDGNASGTTVTELQTSVYKNSQTQLVQFGDKIMLAYIEDCAERDTYNRYRLMYTVYNPSTNEWTQPKAVCDSGKMDIAPSLATDGENVYIAWQTVNTTVTDSTEEALYDAMNNMEIYSAKYDESSDSFVDVTQHTNNSTYDYSPVVTVENGSATVYWINADTLNYNAGEMSIHSSADPSNTVIYDNMNYITSLQVSDNSVSYSMDVDGDLSTNDVKLFTDGVQVGEDVIEDTIITNFAYGDYNGTETLFYSDGGNVFYVADGKSEYAFSDNNGIASAIKITNLNGKPAVVYTQPTATGSELRVSTFENDEWSEPVFLTDTNSSISNVDVVSVNGKLYGVFNRTQTTEATDEAGEAYLEYGQTDLCMLTSEGYYDLEISNIGYDEGNFSVGSSSPFIVVMENDGTEIINNVEFTVSDSLGYSKTVTKDVNLAPGVIESVELQYVAQEGYTACDLTVTANIVGENDINKDNNTTTEQIGRTDISVGAISVERIADVYKITCEVTNDSLIDAQNVNANITFDIYKKNVTIGTIAAKSSYMVELLVAREELTFDENNICTLTFAASTSSEELVKGNNENTITVENTEKLAEHEHSFVNNICDNCGMNAYTYYSEDNGIVITNYAGGDTEIVIPETVDGVPVVEVAGLTCDVNETVTSVVISNGIRIGYAAFRNCPNLTTITVSEDNPDYSSVDGVLFNKDKTTLIAYPIGKTDVKYTIPDSVTYIEGYAFYGCLNLEEVVIGNKVTSIGDSSFMNCENIKYVFFTGSEEQWADIYIEEDNQPLTKAVRHYSSTDHTYEYIVDTEPTCTVEGSKHQQCTVCGYSLESETVSATGHSYQVTNTLTIHPHTTNYTCSDCGNEKTESPTVEVCILCIYGEDTPIKETENTEIDFNSFVIRTNVNNCNEITQILNVSENTTVEIDASLKCGNEEFYGTGTVITVYDGETYVGDFTLIVEGDTNGDSVCDALDAAQVALASNGHETLDGAYALAADSNYDDIVDINDYQQIVNKAVS